MSRIWLYWHEAALLGLGAGICVFGLFSVMYNKQMSRQQLRYNIGAFLLVFLPGITFFYYTYSAVSEVRQDQFEFRMSCEQRHGVVVVVPVISDRLCIAKYQLIDKWPK